MKNYGIPYMGSKDKICQSLIKVLPSGNRFVDLFGGGFSMTECAARTKPAKWKKFLYNDFNPLVVNLVMDAIKGKYNFKNFTPKWISRETFERERERDGYIKYIWSFGNNGQAYLYGKDIEEWKHKAWDYIVEGKKDTDLLEILPDLPKYVKSKNIHQRRLEFRRCAANHSLGENYQRIQSLKNLQSLTQLESLQRLESLQSTSMSYEDYEYQEGDIVYCDIPYEETASYSGGFDNKKFYDWCDKQPYPIYVSSYKIKNCKWKLIWAKVKIPLLNQQTKTRKYVVECLYKTK